MNDRAKRLADIEAFASEATAEPWHEHDGEVCSRFGGVLAMTDVGEPEDVVFAVAAREAVPWLLSEVHRMQRVIDSVANQRDDEHAGVLRLQKNERDADAALATLGIPDDGRPLAERIKAAYDLGRAEHPYEIARSLLGYDEE